ncbi:MAG: aminoacyl-tRNA hydrolase [Puniceicoccales bacterium]|jgi:PTH1 family peptidyl-tRNA hydrolase|nr:aminoacyl-tRNA hydrolase [Puniceicoccales bacterium]
MATVVTPQTPALIAGLGNPGPEYADTRHNAGFRVLDALAAATGGGAVFAPDTRHRALVAKTSVAGRPVWLVKPLTFMNDSGLSIGPLAAFHKIPHANVLVVYDDITLAPGTAKLTTGGGDGGHNGIKSILAHCPNAFARYRVGIGPKHWPTQDLAAHVLGKLTETERAAHTAALPAHLENIRHWLAHGTAAAQNHINRRRAENAPKPPKTETTITAAPTTSTTTSTPTPTLLTNNTHTTTTTPPQ